MQKVLKFIKRKRNLRRLSVVCLMLVTIELFCPAFCDEPAFAAEINSPKTQSTANTDEKNGSTETSLDACEHQNSGSHDAAGCNDECLCHATAIPSINGINFTESINCHESIAFHYGNLVFKSLPPPFQPPKNS